LPLKEAFKLLISDRKFDFKLSSSLGVMEGILLGVGAGGISKSRRFDILFLFTEGVDAHDMSGMVVLFEGECLPCLIGD